MKILPGSVPLLQKICGAQAEKPGADYRKTTLALEVGCDGGKLLYHTLTGVLILLEDAREWESRRAELIQNRFLVPTDFDEAAYADEALAVAALLQKKKTAARTHFTILTTTDCNARCYYCYEAGVSKCTMTEATARAVADYIARVSGGEKVEISWFGGEPLLNIPAIDCICTSLAAAGVPFSSKMTSNGYLFDAAAVEKAKTLWNLQSIQITLDGTAENYERIKAYTDASGGAFARVLSQISHAIGCGVNVCIRLNVCEDNIDDLSALIDELAAYFPNREHLLVYTSFLGDFRGDGRFSSRVLTAERYFALKQKAADAGFSVGNRPLSPEWKSNACMADNDGSDIILPDGGLCRCEHVLGQARCGQVDKDERDEEVLRRWKERVRLPECPACALYPRCINLKKCAWVGAHCSDLIRTVRKRDLAEQMLASYYLWKGEQT